MKIYVSHQIQGPDGEQATEQSMQENCQKAIQWAELLRMNLGHNAIHGKGIFVGGPDGLYLTHRDTLYVPAEHEEFVHRAYVNGMLTIDQILEIDCDIVKSCDALIALGQISNGMRKEIDCAHANGLKIVFVEL